MKVIMMVLLAAMLDVACNKERKEEATEEGAGKLCYTHAENKDTINMTIVIQDKNISGELTYKIFEKDRNQGQLNGVLSGDTIIATYTFESEGITSVREVAFLRKENTLVEGFGTMDSTGTHFSSRRGLTFSGMELHKTDCGD